MGNIHILRILLFACLAALLNPGASADFSYILGAGNAQCGKYLEDRRTSDDDRTASIYYSSWVAGFVTAWNVRADLSEQMGSHRLKNETVVAYLDKYCRDNPLGSVIEGTLCLMSDVGYKMKMSCHRDSEKENKAKPR